MAEQRVQRRLAAILAADVAGYSRLMGEDEEGTLATLTAHRAELIEPCIAEHRGRMFKTTGDGLLAEFASVVDAVRCAVAFQAGMAGRNAGTAEDKRMEFRIGINLGDVIDQDDDVHGDGVNVAARLEGLAEPGGICMSGSVHDQVHNKLDLAFTDMGEQQVKNIARPIRVFKVATASDRPTATAFISPHPSPRRKSAIAASIAVVIAVAVGLYAWRPWVGGVEPASIDKMAFKLPEKPSIAVLAFDNLSGDAKQEYFSDGISENIITALSKIPAMFVIARNSTFTYKGKPVKVQVVAEELGVRYVLEGSVQREGDRVRITAQLIDALNGHHLWAERYDRDFKDIFALQDDIARNVVTALQVKLTVGERARALRRETDNPQAYELYLRSRELRRHVNKASFAEARELLEKAVALDPDFAAAWLGLAAIHRLGVRLRWTKNRRRSLSLAGKALRKALAIDDTSPSVYLALAGVAFVKRQYDQGIAHCEKALSLAPSAGVMAHCGRYWTYVGRPREALELTRKAMRRNPYFPPIYFYGLGNSHRLMGNYDEAIAAYKAWHKADPKSVPVLVNLTSTYAEAGKMEQARAAAKKLLKRSPKYSLKRSKKVLTYKDPADKQRFISNLGKAGVPE